MKPLVGLRRRSPTISLSALVDVLFILIVFVILAADFDRVRAVDVELPAAGTGRAIEAREVRLVVPANGPVRLAGEAEAIEDDELEARLAAARARAGGAVRELVLVADGEVALARATQIIDAARRAGFESVSIATREPR